MTELIADACLLFPGWTPAVVLEMAATLFFQMLTKGRVLAARKLHRHYYELCRVGLYPTCTEESKQELLQYYFDSSLTPQDWAARERERLGAEKIAAANYQPTSAVLDMIRGTRGAHV